MPINGFEADDLVICSYRLPSPLQPWVSGIHIGRVLAVLRQVRLYLASRPQRLAVVQALTCANRNGSSGKALRLTSYFRRSERCNGVLLESRTGISDCPICEWPDQLMTCDCSGCSNGAIAPIWLPVRLSRAQRRPGRLERPQLRT